MTIRKYAEWFLVFAVLFAFTFSAAHSAFAESDQDAAYANVLEQNPASDLLITFDETSNGSDSFMNGLQNLFAHQVVCSITQEQFDQLSSQYEVGVQTIEVSGEDVQIANVSGDGLNPADLREQIEARSNTCKIVKHANIFYLIFGGSVS